MVQLTQTLAGAGWEKIHACVHTNTVGTAKLRMFSQTTQPLGFSFQHLGCVGVQTKIEKKPRGIWKPREASRNYLTVPAEEQQHKSAPVRTAHLCAFQIPLRAVLKNRSAGPDLKRIQYQTFSVSNYEVIIISTWVTDRPSSNNLRQEERFY